MKRIKAQVDKEGKISLEFIGFPGRECVENRKRLQDILLYYGVELKPLEIKEKSISEISQEISKGEEISKGGSQKSRVLKNE